MKIEHGGDLREASPGALSAPCPLASMGRRLPADGGIGRSAVSRPRRESSLFRACPDHRNFANQHPAHCSRYARHGTK
jgi:hypothetical protein